MNSTEFADLIERFTRAAEAGNGTAFAACFTEDGVYYDYIYGPHRGRPAIADMMHNLFHRDAGPDYRWEIFDPVCDGDLGYAWSLSSFTSTMSDCAGHKVLIDGISRFRLRDGLIYEYRESVNGCVAMSQLDVAPARMAKIARRWAERLLKAPESVEFLSRAKGTRRAK
jgi:ketosteroid isomerase-like protein